MELTEQQIHRLDGFLREEELHYKYNVNYGGCGWFALYLYQALLKYGVKTKIIFSRRGYKNIKEEYENDKFLGPNHVIIKYGKFYFDSKGVFKDFDKNYKYNDSDEPNKNEFDVDFLKKILNESIRWNSQYNTGNNSTIKEKIESIVTKVLGTFEQEFEQSLYGQNIEAEEIYKGYKIA